MDEFRFNSIKELYKRVLPALSAKVSELKRSKINYITEEEIWDYLRYNYWTKKSNLTLGEIVNDILSTPNFELEEYHMKNVKKDDYIGE